MSTRISMQTTSGRSVTGINYSVNASTLPTSPPALAAGMQGGLAYGVYHLRGTLGWLYIPANQIYGMVATPGAPT